MSSFTNRERAERVERDGRTRTQVEETRSVIRGSDPYATGVDEVVDRRVVRSLDFSAATINGLLGIVLLALESLIAVRFLLIAFGARTTSGFVRFMLDLSWPFVRPFSNAFALHRWDQGVIEPASLLAMGVYAIIFALVMLLISAVVPEFRGRHDVARSTTTRL